MITVFVDMDGVVADFDGYANRTLGIETTPGYRFSQEDWYKLRKHNQRIYRDLPLTSTALNLIYTLKELRDVYGFTIIFLTAVPHENDLGWAFTDKVEWARKYFPGIPVWFGPYSADKYRHCGDGDVLIDDRVSNIKEWPGHAILHNYNDVDATINDLKGYLDDLSR